VGDSCLHTVARELIVVIAQWTTNTVHLLSWPDLVRSLLSFPASLPCLDYRFSFRNSGAYLEAV
jgi:uncharacterized protein (DUF2126 family)